MNYKYVVARSYATLGYVGYFPAPGTCATVAVLPFVWALHLCSLWVQIGVLVMMVSSAFIAIRLILPSFVTPDPSCIVIDEVVGIIVAFSNFSIGLDYTPCAIVVLFRLLDITKPFGISYLEKLPGAWGILLDDVIAGIVTNLLMRVAICLWL